MTKIIHFLYIFFFLFGLHELILGVSEDSLSLLLCIHNVDMKTFGLHGLILYVS